MEGRLEKSGLELDPEKTRADLESGRHACEIRKQRGEGSCNS